MRRTLLVLALLLTAGHAAAGDSDDDFAPPTRARRGATEGSPRSSVEGSAEAASGDPAGAVATAKGGDGRRGFEEVNFVLEHSLVMTPGAATHFAPCGVFTARAHYDRANPDAVRLSHLKLQRDPADDDFVAKFSKLVDDDLNYRVRLPANVLHPRADEHVVAYVPSRCLADAGLQENFALHMDERGNVVGVDYTTAGGECHADTPAVPLGKDPKFRTTAAVRFYKVAPQLDPDAPTDVRGHGGPGNRKQHEEKQRRAREGKDGKAPPPREQTFWEKNWMYILAASFLISNFMAPPPEQTKKRA